MSLATAVTALEAKRDALIAELTALDLTGPDVSMDGVSISVTAYAESLQKRIETLQATIDAFGGPVVVYTQGR